MTCAEFRAEYEKLFGQRSPADCPAGLRPHLDACDACREYVRQFLILENMIHGAKVTRLPAHLQERIRETPARARAIGKAVDPAPDVRKFAALVLPAAVVFVAAMLLPPDLPQALLLGALWALGTIAGSST